MSNIYHTEPPTHGKVLLHTSFGDIDIELWSKECPKACKNFVQLAMEGYYDNTVFHRVIRKFMVQGGDPTGTGNGGESIYGKPFRDEIHTRVKFNHRGQVAMANENAPGTNHSQFFFTLDSAPHLDKKHTIFGKITGNTIFNALRMGDVETDKDDRPLEPPRLVSVEVLLNPFDDVVPRNLSKAQKGDADDAAENRKKKIKKKGKKDFKLLSFGEEADQEEKALEAKPNERGIKSAHDALDDDKFSKDAAYDVEAVRATAAEASAGAKKDSDLRTAVKSAASRSSSSTTGESGERKSKKSRKAEADTDTATAPEERDADDQETPRHPEGFDDGDAFMAKMRQKMIDKRKALESDKKSSAGLKSASKGAHDKTEEDQLDFEGDDVDSEEEKTGGGEGEKGDGWAEGDETEKEKARRKAIKARAKEFESLREELKMKHRAARVMTGEERAKYDAEHKHREMLSPVEQMRAKFKKRRKEAGTREDSTMAKLAKFTSTIRTAKKPAAGEKEGKNKVEAYHGQVTEGQLYEGEDDADDGEDWFKGPLKFKKHIDDDLRRGSDGRNANDYAVIDPLKNGAAAGGHRQKTGRDGKVSLGGAAGGSQGSSGENGGRRQEESRNRVKYSSGGVEGSDGRGGGWRGGDREKRGGERDSGGSWGKAGDDRRRAR